MRSAFEYKSELDRLAFTPAQKEDMAARLCAAAQRSADAPKPRRRSRSAVIAVAVAACLCVAAGATGAAKLAGDVFAPVFGAANTEIVNKIGHPIGASATDGGVTITADAIIGDAHHYAIVYTIAKADGSAFDFDTSDTVGDGILPLSFDRQDTELGLMGGAHGSSWFYDADSSDNAIQFIEERETDGTLSAGHSAKAVFRDLYYGSGEDARLLAQGKWVLRFDLDFEDTSLDLSAGQETTLNGMPLTINRVTLSPLALQVDYTVGSAVQWSDALGGQESAENRAQHQRYQGDLTLLVTMQDGSVLDLTDAGGSLSPEGNTTHGTKGGVFSRIIDTEQAVSVTVGDIVIPVTR